MIRLLALALLASLAGPAPAAGSQCYGTVSKGRLSGAVSLPVSGPNFSAYSKVAAAVGRTYLHSTVAEIVVASYAALQTAAPGTVHVYGETGLASGGRFRPHRTHQNGLSVDFFVPVRDGKDRSVPLPTSVSTRFGYDIEFDASGAYDEYRIDFAALAEHLFQLHAAATARGAGIARVIIDPRFFPPLFDTPRGPWLRATLPFMKATPWVRHDEHFHIDFSVPCKQE